jgi:hypothetical protein
MSRLVVVAPLKEGSLARAKELLAEGPPFALEDSRFDSHEVFLTDREVVFVFEGSSAEGETLTLAAEDPAIARAAEAWAECLDGRPRLARSAWSWKRSQGQGLG